MNMTLDRNQDYADWLPPMVVKELRQGLRTNMFVTVFVGVQAAMIGLLGIRLLGGAGEGWLRDNLSRYQWMAIIAALLVVLPLRGLSAIGTETSQHTLDLVQLTHLSSMRIVFGKWLALVSQTLLLVVSLLPYQVLTYFFGEVDVVRNLVALAWMLFASLALTALCIAVSAGSNLARTVVLGFAAPPVLALSVWLIEFLEPDGARMAPGGSWTCLWLYFGVMGGIFALAVAAARIGHVAENTAAMMRSIVLFTQAGAGVGVFFAENDDTFGWLYLWLPLWAWAGMEAMTERAPSLPSIYLPWVSRGRLVRYAGRLLYPGWASGTAFVLLVMLTLMTTLGVIARYDARPGIDGEHVLRMFHLGMAMVLPGAVLIACPKVVQRHYLYAGIQGACVVLALAASTVREDAACALLSGLTPITAFIWTCQHTGEDSEIWGTNLVAAAAVDVAVLAWMARSAKSEIAAISLGEARARRMLQVAAETSSSHPTPVPS